MGNCQDCKILPWEKEKSIAEYLKRLMITLNGLRSRYEQLTQKARQFKNAQKIENAIRVLREREWIKHSRNTLGRMAANYENLLKQHKIDPELLQLKLLVQQVDQHFERCGGKLSQNLGKGRRQASYLQKMQLSLL